jgi:hypothetical protein
VSSPDVSGQGSGCLCVVCLCVCGCGLWAVACCVLRVAKCRSLWLAGWLWTAGDRLLEQTLLEPNSIFVSNFILNTYISDVDF